MQKELKHYFKAMVDCENKESRLFTIYAVIFCLMGIGIGLFFYFSGKGIG
jgi:hypothetical protein